MIQRWLKKVVLGFYFCRKDRVNSIFENIFAVELLQGLL